MRMTANASLRNGQHSPAASTDSSEFRYQPLTEIHLGKKLRHRLQWPDGEPAGYIGTITDITALKQAEELKDQFLSLVSHELRTPLATIYGSSRLLKDRFDRIRDEDRMEPLSDVVSEAERLQRIIENLLLLTRLDATGIELEPIALQVAPAGSRKSTGAQPSSHDQSRHAGRGLAAGHGQPDLLRAGDSKTCSATPSSTALATHRLTSKFDRRYDRVTVSVLDRGIGFDDDRRPPVRAVLPVEEARTPRFRRRYRPCRLQSRHRSPGRHHLGPQQAGGGGSEFGFSLKGAPELDVTDTRRLDAS